MMNLLIAMVITLVFRFGWRRFNFSKRGKEFD